MYGIIYRLRPFHNQEKKSTLSPRWPDMISWHNKLHFTFVFALGVWIGIGIDARAHTYGKQQFIYFILRNFLYQ